MGREELRVRKTADPIEDYLDRAGYGESFIGSGNRSVPLPGLARGAADVALRTDRAAESVLTYHHYSVVVAREWRMPLFSAVNRDGTVRRRKVPRTNVWKLDPRIDAKYQILEECYGREQDGFFSRGHMTRRKDANWGTAGIAAAADADTFHATNAVPQAQSFNSPIWLGLESHLLRHTNEDEMKVSVITGPVLSDGVPTMFSVRIPTQFWKVVAFVHDRTRKLTAVAYLASQADQVSALRDLQYVFGGYRDWQIPVRRLATLTGLDFGRLASCDPLTRADDRFAFEIRKVADVYTE
jgi:endonuclease G, mitochondrial